MTGPVGGRVVGVDFGGVIFEPFGGGGGTRPPSSGAVVNAGTSCAGGGGGGLYVDGRHATCPWQSAHVVAKVAWPGYVLAS